MGITPLVGLPYAEPGEWLSDYPAGIDKPRADALDALLRPAWSSVTRQAALSLPASTVTPILWDTVDAASPGIVYTPATGLFTAVAAGRYLVSTSLTFAPAPSGTRCLRMMKNGAIWGYRWEPCDASNNHTVDYVTILTLAAGDTLSGVYYGPAGTLIVGSGFRLNCFDIQRLPS